MARWHLWAWVGLALIGGCASHASTPAANVARVDSPSANNIFGGDPSAIRLQNIGGELLLYYRLHDAMPPTLDDLRSVAGAGDETNFTSPTSGQPYVYARTGLWTPDNPNRCIVAYDPALRADGKRVCLLMSQPKAGGALSADVIALPEPIFLNYQAMTR